MKHLSEQFRNMTSTMTAIALIGAGAATCELGNMNALAQDTKAITTQEGISPEVEQIGDLPRKPDMKVEQSGDDQALISGIGEPPAAEDNFVLEQRENEILAKEYIGLAVFNTTGESVGDVNDLVFTKDGAIDAAIVGVGGFLGIGEKEVAIRFDAIQILESDADGGMVLRINSTQEELETAPAFVSMAAKLAEKRAREIERQQSTPTPQGTPNPTLPVPEPAPSNGN